MIWTDFSLRLILASILGAGIGFNLWWQDSQIIIKTNILLSLGMVIFVSIAMMQLGNESFAQIISLIVLVIGGIGANIILREQSKQWDINTAATLWCAIAVGSLVGFGLYVQAYAATVAVMLVNLLLRSREPLSSEQVNVPKQKTKTLSLTPSKTHYRCKLICNSRDEANVLAKLIQSLKDRKLLLTSLHSEHMIDSANDETQDLAITADFIAFNSDPNQLESLLQLVRQIEEKAKIEIID